MNEKDMKIIELSDEQIEGVTGGTIFGTGVNAGQTGSTTMFTAGSSVPLVSVPLASPGGASGEVNVLGAFGGDNSGSLIHFGSEPPAPPVPPAPPTEIPVGIGFQSPISQQPTPDSKDPNGSEAPVEFSAPMEPSQVGSVAESAIPPVQTTSPEGMPSLSPASEQGDTPLKLY